VQHELERRRLTGIREPYVPLGEIDRLGSREELGERGTELAGSAGDQDAVP
jgi:hypothetical protein